MTDGLTSKVRDYIKDLPKKKAFSASEVARMIGEPNALMVQQVFADLIGRGEIIKIEPGRYSYVGVCKLWQKPSPVTWRMLRAMHVSGSFSARDLVTLADGTRNFAYKLICRLEASGEIVPAGKQKNINGCPEKVYRVKDRDAFYLKYLIGSQKKNELTYEQEKVGDENLKGKSDGKESG